MNLNKKNIFTALIAIMFLSTISVYAQNSQNQLMFNKNNIDHTTMIKIQNEDWSKVKPLLLKIQTGYIAYIKALASIEFLSKYQMEAIMSETDATFDYLYKNQSLPFVHMFSQYQDKGKDFGKNGNKNKSCCINSSQLSAENYKIIQPFLKNLYESSTELSKSLLSIGFITKAQNDAFLSQHERNFNYITGKNIAPLYYGLHPFIPRYVLNNSVYSSK